MRKKSVISLLTLVTSLTLTACSFQFSTPKDFPQVPEQVQEISVELGKEISDIVDSTDFTNADQLDQMTTEVVEWAKDYAETEEAIAEFQKATLVRVVDGDTIVVEIDGEEYKVRLIGIDTPESVASEEYLEKTGKENSQAGKDASAFTKEILKNTTTVYLEKDISETDKYGRYHATNEGICTWYEFACEIFKQAGMNVSVAPVSSDEYPAKAKRPSNSRMDKSKLTANGFTPLPTWQDALSRYLKEIEY